LELHFSISQQPRLEEDGPTAIVPGGSHNHIGALGVRE
jgi:hypothetical protein